MAEAALDYSVQLSMPKMFGDIGYAPHTGGQLPVHKAKERFRVLDAGRRWGKSLLASVEAEYMIKHPGLNGERGTRGWVVSKNYNLTSKVFREIHKSMIIKQGFSTVKKQMSGPLILEFPWGSVVEGKSADNLDSLLGEGLDWLIFDECATCTQKTWEQYLRPTLTDREGWALFISTPRGYNWFYDLWKRGKDPNHPDWISWQRPSWTNPHLSKEDIAEAQRTMSEALFMQEYGAQFTIYTGQVYGQFNEDVHVWPEARVEKEINRKWLRYRVIDFGYENPFACLWIAVDPVTDRVIVYDEYVQTHRTVEDHARHLVAKDRKSGDITNSYLPACDTEHTTYEWTVCDISGASARATLRDNGIITIARKSDVIKGLEAVRQLLKARYASTTDPMFVVSSRCVETIKEFNLYSYPDSGIGKEDPVKENDHCMDAIRYFVVNWSTGGIKVLRTIY